MSDDGADLRVKPTTALRAIFGGDQPTEEEMQNEQEWLKSVQGADDLGELNREIHALDEKGVKMEDGYDRQTMAIAKLFYEEMLRDPSIITEHGRPTYRMFDPEVDEDYLKPMLSTPEKTRYYELPDALYDRCIRAHPDPDVNTDPFGATGFMVGFATNAALHALGIDPVSNPAIVQLGRD